MSDRFPLIARLARAGLVTPVTITCPVCGDTRFCPPIPANDSVAEVFGLSGDTLARMHADMEAARIETDIERHLADHTPIEWLDGALIKIIGGNQ